MGLFANPNPPPDERRRAALRTIFEAEADYVWASLRRLGVHARDLEDVTQNVFIEVYRAFDRYDPSRPLRPWLFAFAYRFASDYRRLARHRIELFDEHDEPAAPDALADEALEARDARRLLLAGLESVDLTRRAVFILHELDEVPVNEIASSLQIPINTVYSRLRIAREELTAAVLKLERMQGGRS